jgi:hypothetical protein
VSFPHEHFLKVDANDNKARQLFGYDLKSATTSLLATLKILVKTDLPFTDQLSATSSTLLVQCGSTVLGTPTLQQQYIRTLLIALQSSPFPHSLYPAFSSIIAMRKVELDLFFEGIAQYADLRYEIWRKIRDQEKVTGLTVEEDELKVLHLLTPIDGVLSKEMITTSMIGRDVEKFAQEIEEKMITSANAKRIVRLIRNEAEPLADSRKRKRNGEGEVADPAYDFICEHLSTGDLARESYLKQMISYINS